MHHFKCNRFSLLLFFTILTISSMQAVIPINHLKNNESLQSLKGSEIANKSNKDIEQLIGRELSIKEKLSFQLLKKKLKNNPNLKFHQAKDELRTEGLAVAGFICSLIGIFFAGLVFGTLAVIFGIVALGKIKRNPETKKGRGLAIAAIVIGLVVLPLTIIGIAAMM